jgi:hypothetical protein
MDDVNLKIFACNLRRALVAPEQCDIPYMLETAARELDRLRMLREDTLDVMRVMAENEDLQDRVNRQVKLIAEYGGPRCTAGCPPAGTGWTTCHRAHWCLLPQGHDGEHLWICHVRPPTVDAKKHLEQECRVTEEMLKRRATI